jgi:5-methylcytosine-specific restriction protein A
MKRIPLEHISLAYDLAKGIYLDLLTRQEAIDRVKESGMNVGSANIYFHIYQHLIDGQTFTGTISAESFDYYLKKIQLEDGHDQLSTALKALKLHIEYFENIEGIQMVKVKRIYDKYLNMLSPEVVEEDDEISFPASAKFVIFRLSIIMAKSG